MYRCDLCGKTSKPGQARLKMEVKRVDGSIRRELSICEDCDLDMRVCHIPARGILGQHHVRAAVPAVLLRNRTVDLGDDIPLE